MHAIYVDTVWALGTDCAASYLYTHGVSNDLAYGHGSLVPDTTCTSTVPSKSRVVHGSRALS